MNLSRFIARALLVSLLGIPPGFAKDQGTVVASDAVVSVAELGRQNRDPMLLIAAARLAMSNGAGLHAARGLVDPWSPSALLDQAEVLAKQDPTILRMIRETRETRAKGFKSGVRGVNLTLEPGQSETLFFVMVGHEPADLSVIPTSPGKGDADVRVYDETGALVTENVSPHTGIYGQSAYVVWQPARCGKFRVEITNASVEPVDLLVRSVPAETNDCARGQESTAPALPAND